MITAVTGATGHFGALVVDGLIERGVAAEQIVAIVRNAEKAQPLADRGVQVRVADYGDVSGLKAALEGVDKLLLVSGSDIGHRIAQHNNVIEAAESAGVSLIAYTSLLKADTSVITLAVEHKATEERLASSPIPSVLLRNGWYWENYGASLQHTIDSGVLLGSAGNGTIAGASRADYAAAAVAVLLLEEPQGGKVYELGGDERITYTDLASVIAQNAGKKVDYKDVPTAAHQAALEGAGLPAPVAEMLASTDAGVSRGHLDTNSGDLQKLIGRPSTPVAKVLVQDPR